MLIPVKTDDGNAFSQLFETRVIKRIPELLKWSSDKRSRLLTRKTGFKPIVSQTNTSCHRAATDANFR